MKLKTKIILILIVMSGISIAVSSSIEEKRSDRIKESKQFNGKKFINSIPTSVGSPSDIWSIYKDFRASKSNEKNPLKEIPIVKTDLNQLRAKSSDYKFIWLGHSGFILEIEGIRVLVDGIFAKRASMFQFMGPKRFFVPPIALNDLPELDAIIFSHDHYDHLDKSLVKHYKDSDTPFIMPLGVGKHLKKWGIDSSQIFEFDWNDKLTIKCVDLICTPARHFTGRGITDRDETLWCSWSFIGEKRRIYYSGDTGLTPLFEDIGNNYGPFDISIMQIGAYDKHWEDIHLFPEDAIKAQKMLNAGYMIPVHWGTFNLAFHSWYEPVDRLFEAGKNDNVNLSFPLVGQIIDSTNVAKTNTWWKDL